jgi:FKBP-type peptidyl-prolyl cis-trans isomerase FkpA
MKSSVLQLTFSACLAIAWACGDNSKDAESEQEAAVSTPLGASSNGTATATSSTPITIDKGDGCVVVIQEEGRGRAARIGDHVTLDYVARVNDSETPFASTSNWTERCRIELGSLDGPRVVRGLARGLEGLKGGAKATITIPPALAYGKAGLPSAGIPADATLVFEVQVSGVHR